MYFEIKDERLTRGFNEAIVPLGRDQRIGQLAQELLHATGQHFNGLMRQVAIFRFCKKK